MSHHSTLFSPDERHHLCCPACGARYDLRDLMAVLEHQHRAEPLPRIPPAAAALPLQLPPRRPLSH